MGRSFVLKLKFQSSQMALYRALTCQRNVDLLQRSACRNLSKSIQTLAKDSSEAPDERNLLSVPPEVLELICRRNLSIISLSPYITEGIEEALQASARNSKAIRKSGLALTERLKENSRSKHRGGLHELTMIGGTARLKSANRKVPKWRITAQNIRSQGLMNATDEAADQLEQDYDLPRDEEPSASNKIHYTASETIGYAASRLPACYAVVWRVLDELDMRVTDFRPESMLDFGAGPGTAIWAASEVWEESLKTVHAVEPSEAMRWLGVQIEQRAKMQPQQDGVDALTEEMPDVEQQDSPVGGDFANIDCNESGEEAVEGSNWQASSSRSAFDNRSAFDIGGHSGGGRSEGVAAARASPGKPTVIGDRLSSPDSSFGRSWGIRWLQHLQGFGDRKQMAHGRGRRPSWVQSTGGRKYDLVLASYSFGELQNPSEQRQALKAMWQATSDILVIIEPGTPSGSGLVRAARAQILEWETDSKGHKSAYVVAPCPHDGRCPMDGIQSWCHFSQKFERPRVQRLAKIRHGKPLPRSHQDERFSYVVLRKGPRPQPATDVVTTEQLPLLRDWHQHAQMQREADFSAEELDLPQDEAVKDLIQQSLNDGDDSEDELLWDESKAVSENDPSEEQEAVQDLYEDQEPAEATAAQDNALAWGDLEDPLSQDSSSAASDPNLQDAIAASQQWSRIIRKPRKRRGHVIVDLCTAAGADHSRAPSGVLLQQAVAKGERSKWVGASGYRIIKKVTWGDLWPASFQQYAHSIKERS